MSEVVPDVIIDLVGGKDPERDLVEVKETLKYLNKGGVVKIICSNKESFEKIKRWIDKNGFETLIEEEKEEERVIVFVKTR